MQIFDNQHHPASFISLIEEGIERRALHSIKVVAIPHTLTVKYYTMPEEDAVIKVIAPDSAEQVKIALGSHEEMKVVMDSILRAVMEVTDKLTV